MNSNISECQSRKFPIALLLTLLDVLCATLQLYYYPLSICNTRCDITNGLEHLSAIFKITLRNDYILGENCRYVRWKQIISSLQDWKWNFNYILISSDAASLYFSQERHCQCWTNQIIRENTFLFTKPRTLIRAFKKVPRDQKRFERLSNRLYAQMCPSACAISGFYR